MKKPKLYLPSELLFEISSFLPEIDVIWNVGFVCKSWRREIAFPLIENSFRKLMNICNHNCVDSLEQQPLNVALELASFNDLFITRHGRKFLRFQVRTMIFNYAQ